MKTIKLKYVDMWGGFDQESFIFTEILREKYNVVFSDQPDYLFYSCFGYDHLKYSDCIRICYLGENLAPDFNVCDYAIAQECLDFGDRYLWFPTGMPRATRPELYHRENRLAKKENRARFCSFVYSNATANPYRLELLHAIEKYKKVDCGGKLCHNIDIPHVEGFDRFDDRIEFERNYKFSIACENDSHPGYCTEKILISFIAGTIPIYWGDPLIKNVYNEKAFICVSDYNTTAELVDAIKRIDNDDTLYQAMIQEPVFAPGWNYCDLENGLKNFILNIFEQPKEKAFRRCRIMYAKDHCDTLNNWYNTWKEMQETPKWKFWKRFR